jgi:hypothetical protein
VPNINPTLTAHQKMIQYCIGIHVASQPNFGYPIRFTAMLPSFVALPWLNLGHFLFKKKLKLVFCLQGNQAKKKLSRY